MEFEKKGATENKKAPIIKQKNTPRTELLAKQDGDQAQEVDNPWQDQKGDNSNAAADRRVSPKRPSNVAPKITLKTPAPQAVDKIVNPPTTEIINTPPLVEKINEPPKAEKVNEPLKTEIINTPPLVEKISEPPKAEKANEPPKTAKVSEPPKAEELISIRLDGGSDQDQKKEPDTNKQNQMELDMAENTTQEKTAAIDIEQALNEIKSRMAEVEKEQKLALELTKEEIYSGLDALKEEFKASFEKTKKEILGMIEGAFQQSSGIQGDGTYSPSGEESTEDAGQQSSAKKPLFKKPGSFEMKIKKSDIMEMLKKSDVREMVKNLGAGTQKSLESLKNLGAGTQKSLESLGKNAIKPVFFVGYGLESIGDSFFESYDVKKKMEEPETESEEPATESEDSANEISNEEENSTLNEA
ncbi:MAG: hypothetical protein HQ517_06180 [SAR324 cluster bacterium]|nr:hypothetical protein [SAR324 cluster bacterium]